MVPGHSAPANVRSGDVQVAHREMKGVRVTLGQASHLDPAGALTSPCSPPADVRATEHRYGAMGRNSLTKNPDS
jgi:hypothetical protein